MGTLWEGGIQILTTGLATATAGKGKEDIGIDWGEERKERLLGLDLCLCDLMITPQAMINKNITATRQTRQNPLTSADELVSLARPF